MPALANGAPEPSSAPQSVRVQVYSHAFLGNKDIQPLASFRLRSSASATFADLAASVLERYARTQPNDGLRLEMGCVLDEKDCAFDMDDPIDIIQPQEFVRFVLAKPIEAAVRVPSSDSVPPIRPSLEDPSAPPTAGSLATATPNPSSHATRTAGAGPPRPSQRPPTRIRSSSSEPVEVDAHGTPVLSKKSTYDELAIPRAVSIGSSVSRSSQVPSSPTRPAVKKTAFARSGPIRKAQSVLQQLQTPSHPRRVSGTRMREADSRSTPATTQPDRPAPNAVPVPAARPIPEPTIETPRQVPTKVDSSAQKSAPPPRVSKRDPYDFPSDSEGYDLPVTKPPSHGTPGSNIRATKVIKQEAKPAHEAKWLPPSVTPSKPLPTNTTTTTTVDQKPTPVTKVIPGSGPKTPGPKHQDPEMIDLVNPSHLQESRRKTLKAIARGTTPVIALSDSDSESQSVETDVELLEMAQDMPRPTPAQPSLKALGKRAHHSVNDHIEIVDPHRAKTPSAAVPPILVRNSRGVVPIYPKGSSPSAVSSPQQSAGPGVPLRSTRQSGKPPKEAPKPRESEANRPSQEAATKRKGSTTTGPASPDTAIQQVKSKMEVKFGKKGPKPSIPDAFFAEPTHSDDEYQASSSAEDVDPEDKNTTQKTTAAATGMGRHRSSSVVSSYHTKEARPRSVSRGSSHAAVTPINTLKQEAQSRQPAPSNARFHRGYSKRVRETFSDASDSEYSEEDEESSSDESMEEKPRWKPMDWIMKFQTMFGTQHQEVTNGPFQGYIPFGPHAGTYLPGYSPPSDAKLAEAEKTAVRRDGGSEDWSDAASDVDDASELEEESEEEVERPAVLKHTDAGTGDATRDDPTASVDPQHLAVPSRGLGGSKPRPGRRTEIPSSQTPELSITSDDEEAEAVPSPLRDQATEQSERLDRTTQYVLTGHRALERPTSTIRTPGPIANTLSPRLPSNLAPATTPTAASSPPSGVSETTSIQIAQQLTQESQSRPDPAPPSNQELGILLSSSPVRASHPKRHAAASQSKTPRLAARADHDDSLTTSSSTEASAGIPARLPLSTPQKEQRCIPATPQAVSTSPPLENVSPSAGFILNGISQRRSTRLMSMSSATRPHSHAATLPGLSRAPSATPERPSSGTPSKPPRHAPAAPQDHDETLSPQGDPDDGTAHSGRVVEIAVELPTITAEKQAEYAAVSAAVSPKRQPDEEKLHPLKSFEAINKVSSTNASVQTPEPRDAAEEALEYVLRESPKWLNSITPAVAAPDPVKRSLASRVTTATKGSRRSSASIASTAGAIHIDVDTTGHKKDDGPVPSAPSWTKPANHPVTPVPVPVLPTFRPIAPTGPTLAEEASSPNRAAGSKKRKRASTASEAVTLASDPLVHTDTGKHREMDMKKRQPEEPPDLEGGEGEEQGEESTVIADAGLGSSAVAQDMDALGIYHGDASPSKGHQTGTKRKRNGRRQTQQPNREETTPTGSYGRSATNDRSNGTRVAEEDDEEPPKKKKRKRKNKNRRSAGQDGLQAKKQNLHTPLRPPPRQEGHTLSRKQRRQLGFSVHGHGAGPYRPSAVRSPTLPPPGHKDNGTTNHRSGRGAHANTHATGTGTGTAPLPRPRAHSMSASTWKKADRDSDIRSSARSIITPPATSRPSSPESMRVG